MIYPATPEEKCWDVGSVPHGLAWALLPPYEVFTPLPASLVPERLPAGAVVALRVNGWPRDLSSFSDAVRLQRARFRAAPVVLWVPADPHPDVLHLAYSAARLGLRAVLLGDGPHGDTLRRACTRPLDLGTTVLEWLALRGVRIPPVLGHLLGQIFQHAARYPELRSLLATLHVPETSLRSRCAKLRLPPPSHWHQAARALHAALAIQADPASPLSTLAFRLGYGDHSALSQLLYRTFSVRPGMLRGTVGWEWLMERWCLQKIDRKPLPAAIPWRGRDGSDERDAVYASLGTGEPGTIVARSGSTAGAAGRPPAVGVLQSRARSGAMSPAFLAEKGPSRAARQVPQLTLSEETTMIENPINDELFAEELPEQVDLTEAAGCFGTFGTLGSVGGCAGTFGTFGCYGGDAPAPDVVGS